MVFKWFFIGKLKCCKTALELKNFLISKFTMLTFTLVTKERLGIPLFVCVLMYLIHPSSFSLSPVHYLILDRLPDI